ncbi:SpoIIE family protein phosphatase [Streptomyces broussonetiae]|uniref:SpoIIE family protein phosphatase n=1 Tax=Streptomyces broussonetiae TaxID=2686304 RepID=A0A6I6NHF7_9ACTN|nr:SpoIIE family protein phosphatase [Streptomyces broussonetiae]
MLNCGHPPPLLIRGDQVTVLNSRRPSLPLGLCALCTRNDRSDPFTLEPGDMLLLYTDGVIEARSPTGAFYPLAERLPPSLPQAPTPCCTAFTATCSRTPGSSSATTPLS